MRLIIAGGRDYTLTASDFAKLDLIHESSRVTEVVSGKARGADTWGEVWAGNKGIPVKDFPADWDRYHKREGYLRNRAMAEYADAVALFPGNKGTNNMHEEAVIHKLVIYDYRYAEAS